MIRVCVGSKLEGRTAREDTARAVAWAVELERLGCAAFVPHSLVSYHAGDPARWSKEHWRRWAQSVEQWMAHCHVLVRIGPRSRMSDVLVGLADELGVKVVRSVAELRAWAPETAEADAREKLPYMTRRRRARAEA